jgi:hypothetical protein
MRNFFRLDTLLTILFFLVMPLLLFTTVSILSFYYSGNIQASFESGLVGSILGFMITLILRKFVYMTAFEIPPMMLIVSYLIYALFFYTLLQGLPFLVFIAGIFVGLYYRRSFVVLRKPVEEYSYKVFQLSFLTSVTIGIFSLFTCCILYFHLSDLENLIRVQAFIDSLPRHAAALVLVSSCSLISLIQFLLTKFILLYKKRLPSF